MKDLKIRLTKDDIDDLKAFLEEYLLVFKEKKKHQKLHKKEPCPICKTARKLLKNL